MLLHRFHSGRGKNLSRCVDKFKPTEELGNDNEPNPPECDIDGAYERLKDAMLDEFYG